MVYKRIIAWEVNRRSWNVLLCNCGGGWLVVNNTCGVVRCRTQLSMRGSVIEARGKVVILQLVTLVHVDKLITGGGSLESLFLVR